MAVDFRMLTETPGFGEGFLQGRERAQQNLLAQQQLQHAQQQLEQSRVQTQMSNMQYEQAVKDRAALDSLSKVFAQQGETGTLPEIADKMIASGLPQYVQIGVGIKQKVAEQARFAQIMGGGFGETSAAPTTMPAGAPAMTPAPAAPSPVRNALMPEGAAPAAPVSNAMVAPATAPVSDVQSQVRALQARQNALLGLGTPQAIAAANAVGNQIKALQTQHVVAPGGALIGPSGQVLYQAAEKPEAPTELMRNYEYAKKQGYKGSLFDYEREMKLAGRTITPAQPQPPVAVVDPVTGKQIYVTREEALKGRMTPAAAMESLPPKEIQKREAALPQATSAIKAVESKSDSLIRDLKALRDDPGLEQITGMVYGRTPSVSREGSRAQALYDKIVAKGGFELLQQMRDASKTGGALGNVSNQEGKQLQAAFAALDRRQNTADVRAAIDQVIGDIEGAKTRSREAYESTYSYKQGGVPAAAPAAPAAPSLDALLNKYK